MNIAFTPDAWKDYLEWSGTNKFIFKKINDLIEDIQRNGLMTGKGHPEKLKKRKEYSRHITEEHRLVYYDENKNLIITSCKGHYT
jgi:toxin YoeB